MIIVDGYNFIYAMRGIEHRMPIDDLEAARRELHEALVRFQNIADEAVRVVYDARGGEPQHEAMGSLEIVFAPPNTSADDYIARCVRHSPHPARITVVTSDKELGDRVKAAEGKVMRSAAFYKRLTETFEKGKNPPDDKSAEKPSRPSRDEIDFFLEEFGKDS